MSADENTELDAEARNRQEAQSNLSRKSTTGSMESKDITELKPFLESLAQSYEEITLPSRGLLYGASLPEGKINMRPMTMKEEKILATQRLVRSGQAIDMIYESCMKENIPATSLLSVDRTFILIWLRGISYGPEYDVNIKCPNCSRSFPETINLDDLPVEFADDGVSEPKMATFPKCGQSFKYRFSRGEDESKISRHKDRRLRDYGDEAPDDSLLFRDALLVTEIAGFTEQSAIRTILENLGMEDITYLRSLIRDPGFGVDTSLPLICPFCSSDFNVDLPVDVNFFFPQKRKKPHSN